MFGKNYSQHYELLNKKKPYKKEIEFVWEWAHRPKRILDLGCGTAQYWQYYPRGVCVFGVEKSPDMIQASKHKKRIICRDMTEANPFWTQVDLVTALFDVINYVDRNDWWKNLPLSEGGYFIFDIWDKEKVTKEGFRKTVRQFGNLRRTITPQEHTSEKVSLRIDLQDGDLISSEVHQMYLYDIDDIQEFAGSDFDIVGVQKTKGWQTWIKLKRK